MLFKQPYENMRLDGKIWEILQRCEDLKRKSMQTLDLAPVKGEFTGNKFSVFFGKLVHTHLVGG
jgi:hypothetical protein